MIIASISIISVLMGMASLPVAAADTMKPLSPENETRWKTQLLEHRAQKDTEFKTDATSPMAGLKRFSIPADQKGKVFIQRKEDGIFLTSTPEPGNVLAIFRNADKWQWEPVGEPVIPLLDRKPLTAGEVPEGRSLVTIHRFTLMVIPGSKSATVIVFDPQRPQIKHFTHLLYFPPDPAFAVKAVIKKYDKIEKIVITTSRNEKKNYYRYAAVYFKIKGKDHRLSAYRFSLDDPHDRSLFIPFSDKTSSKSTYEVGRFMDLAEPADGTCILDFNYAYNPLCNYASVYNCPVPPFENHLEVAIEAGEKTYPH